MVPEKLASIAADPDVFLKEAKAAPSNSIELSIIVPVLNEAHALPELAGGLRQELTKLGRTWEMIFVNDGSTDGSEEILNALADEEDRIRVIHFRRNFGKTAAMRAGVEYAKGKIVIRSDDDVQNDPGDIEKR